MSLANSVHLGIIGKSLFPAKPDKRPLVRWSDYQQRLPTPEEVDGWSEHRGPWAMACGKISRVVVLDFDGEEGRELLRRFKASPTYQKTWEYATPKGAHLWYEYPENQEIADRIKNKVRLIDGLDVRTDGGYVLVPCSYDEGRRWVVSPDDLPKPAPLPQWFINLVNKGSSTPSLPPPRESAGGLPKGVAEGERNHTCARLAGRYLRRGMSAEETVAILVAWNRQNSPPLPLSEIEQTVASIKSIDDKKPSEIQVIDSVELGRMSLEPPPMLINPLLPVGGKMILAGNGGVGKSLLALNLSMSVSNGMLFVDRFPSKQGKVLYLDAENLPSLTNKRVDRMARATSSSRANMSFIFPPRKIDFGNPRKRQEITNLVERGEYSLIVLDSFLCYTNMRNENDNTEVRRWLEDLGDLPRQTGCAILVLDHAGKPSAEKAKQGIRMSPRGAGAKVDWADVVLTLEEYQHEARFLRSLCFPKVRFAPPVNRLILEMDTNYVFRGKEDESVCPVYTIRQVISDEPGIHSSDLAKKLSELTGCGERTARRAIARGEQLGYIRSEPDGKKGRGRLFFQSEPMDQQSLAMGEDDGR